MTFDLTEILGRLSSAHLRAAVILLVLIRLANIGSYVALSLAADLVRWRNRCRRAASDR